MQSANITELMQGIVAEFTTLEDAAPLPDWMLFPAALSLADFAAQYLWRHAAFG